MNWWLLIIIPFLSAFTGWAGNWLLIKLLFHPQKPLRLPGFTIQGIYPKRQKQLAAQLSALVSRELLSFSDLEAKITSPDSFSKIKPTVEEHVDDFLRNKLKEAFPMIGMLIGDRTINTLKEIFMNELETLFPVIMKAYMQNLQKDLNLDKLISDKITSLTPSTLEAALYANMGKELAQARLVGLVLGLLVGLIQVGIIILFQ
ncbi:hypothetical protein A3860_10280 [Niastella vici]|uniref:DUF445 domain-containing protein n=1 Tax=Niastella vici TaxID=1703345 RepID=A0A1V9FF17_9BACT|nr:DUF445 family protein [Niastella vici]OQP56952.1 hypothetical protein A3860_10280 [Niastella vici]